MRHTTLAALLAMTALAGCGNNPGISMATDNQVQLVYSNDQSQKAADDAAAYCRRHGGRSAHLDQTEALSGLWSRSTFSCVPQTSSAPTLTPADVAWAPALTYGHLWRECELAKAADEATTHRSDEAVIRDADAACATERAQTQAALPASENATELTQKEAVYIHRLVTKELAQLRAR
jgi:hypothetical protein